MGTVNLKTASGGSVILSPTNTAVDTTITVPASNGTMAINGPAFSAYQSVAQVIPSATTTKVTFTSVEYDTNNCYSASRFTPNVPGYYQVNFGFLVPSTSRTSEIQLALLKPGAGASYYSGPDVVSSSTIILTMSMLLKFNGTTDYTEAYIYLGTGGTTAPASIYTVFQAAMVRSA